MTELPWIRRTPAQQNKSQICCENLRQLREEENQNTERNLMETTEEQLREKDEQLRENDKKQQNLQSRFTSLEKELRDRKSVCRERV